MMSNRATPTDLGWEEGPFFNKNHNPYRDNPRLKKEFKRAWARAQRGDSPPPTKDKKS